MSKQHTAETIVEQVELVGTIKAIEARGSIGRLLFTHGGAVLFEANATLRAFESAFGDVRQAVGQTIEYGVGVDGWNSNLLAWFVPA